MRGVARKPTRAEIDLHLKTEAFGKATATGPLLRQILLGGQDGLVNVLGILLGVAEATGSSSTVLVAGLAATFAESISMGAVAYTSSQAERDYYLRHLAKEKKEIEEIPEIEEEEVRLIYKRMGFKGAALARRVKDTISDKKRWLDFMMKEELGFSESAAKANPLGEAAVVMLSAFVGSAVPLLPFFLLAIGPATTTALAISLLILLVAGFLKGKMTTGNPYWRAAELAIIGMLSALAGYLVGALFKAVV